MQYTLCRHIKTNGTQCEAPSLRDSQWCFFHSRLHQRHNRFRPIEVFSDAILRIQPVHLNALEDHESVQVALSVVLNALASNQMEPRQASTLLYGLQIASSNLARIRSSPSPTKVIVSAEPTPEGQFLAEPGTVCEIIDENLTWDYVEEDEDEDEDQYEED